jgi:hypothetical protein
VPPSGPADRKVLDAILERAASDRAFREQLLSDWRTAIQQSFSIVIPRSFTMRFIERDPGIDAMIVLPDLRAADGELSDDELENVAGGATSDETAKW